MEVKLNGSVESGEAEAPRPRFPYANWGPWAALLGIPVALIVGIFLGLPAYIADNPGPGEELGTVASAVVQLTTALGFLLVPFGLAMMRGAGSVREAARRLGLRGFEPSALLWLLAAAFAYLVLAATYTAIFGEPKQEDVTKNLGPVAVQIVLIVIAAPIGEEVCFRGMLFGGLRERMPAPAAAGLSGLIFGLLHAPEGITVVLPLAIFGTILALLYEKTGSLVPGILLHMLNNSVALLGQ